MPTKLLWSELWSRPSLKPERVAGAGHTSPELHLLSSISPLARSRHSTNPGRISRFDTLPPYRQPSLFVSRNGGGGRAAFVPRVCAVGLKLPRSSGELARRQKALCVLIRL